MDYCFYEWSDEYAEWAVFRREDRLLLELHHEEDDAIEAVNRLNAEQDNEFGDEPAAPVVYAPGAFGIFTDFDQMKTHIGGRLVIFNGIGRKVRQVNYPAGPDAKATVMLGSPVHGMILARGQQPVNDLEPITVDVDDPGFNSFRFNSLGWANLEDGATLLELKPIRQTRRGYGDENVGVYRFPDNQQGWIERPDNVFIPGLFAEEGFAEMLAGQYPAFNDAAELLLATEGVAVAISPLLCMQSDNDGHVWLWRYGDRIAYIPDPLTVRLGKRWRFLQEELQESGSIPNGVQVK